MEDYAHYIQDAAEIYFAAQFLALVEKHNLTYSPAQENTKSSRDLSKEFDAYLRQRELSEEKVRRLPEGAYLKSIDTHIHSIYGEVINKYPNDKIYLKHVAKESRAILEKHDFELYISSLSDPVKISFKNYKNSITRIQVSSGTFQSLALSFILERVGVGKWRCEKLPDDTERASSAQDFAQWRDSAIRAELSNEILAEKILVEFRKLDTLSREMREAVLTGDKFKIYNESLFKSLRQQVGNEGVEIVQRVMKLLPSGRVKTRLIEMSGMIPGKDILIISPDKYAHSISGGALHTLCSDLDKTVLTIDRSGQSLKATFSLTTDSEKPRTVLAMQIPFTINANGAWHKPKQQYEGKQFHRKENKSLLWGERRPKKSREIATSINTYLDMTPILNQRSRERDDTI